MTVDAIRQALVQLLVRVHQPHCYMKKINKKRVNKKVARILDDPMIEIGDKLVKLFTYLSKIKVK